MRIACHADNEAVNVEVHDDGRGIDAGELPTLFEPFRQAHGAGGAHRRLGLGPAIARSIVDLSRGTLQARRPGQGGGATLRVRLPRSTAPVVEAAPPESPGAAELARLRGLRVRYVEDDADIAEGVRQMLLSLGVTVGLCASHEPRWPAWRITSSMCCCVT